MEPGSFQGNDGRMHRWQHSAAGYFLQTQISGKWTFESHIEEKDWPIAKAALDALIEEKTGEWVNVSHYRFKRDGSAVQEQNPCGWGPTGHEGWAALHFFRAGLNTAQEHDAYLHIHIAELEHERDIEFERAERVIVELQAERVAELKHDNEELLASLDYLLPRSDRLAEVEQERDEAKKALDDGWDEALKQQDDLLTENTLLRNAAEKAAYILQDMAEARSGPDVWYQERIERCEKWLAEYGGPKFAAFKGE